MIDSTLTEIETSSFFNHHGIKGMHWGTRHSKAELEAKAADHEAKSEAYYKAAKSMADDADDLDKNGLKSDVIKRVYGDDAANQSEWGFYGKNGKSRAQAISETRTNLRIAHNSYARASNKHAAKAVKLRAQAAEAEHSDLTDEFLDHHGIKGMHWGTRKAESHPESEDSSNARALQTQVKRGGGTKTLSNAELQALVTRMNLETQYSKLSEKNKTVGKKFTDELVSELKNEGKQQAKSYVKDQTPKIAAALTVAVAQQVIKGKHAA